MQRQDAFEFDRAGEQHRLQLRHRRDDARASDLKGDAIQSGHRFFRRVFIGDGPARRLRRGPERIAQTPFVELHHRAIRGVRKIFPREIEFLHRGQKPGLRFGRPEFFRDWQSRFLDEVKPFDLCRAPDATQLSRPVKHNRERTLRHQARIELLQRPGGGVERVRESRLARGFTLAVQLVEGSSRVIDLAPHLQYRRMVPDLERQLLDGAEICRDVVTALAVAAREALHKPPLLVTDAHRDAVDFRLDDEAELFVRQLFLNAVDKGLELRGGVSVVEALHGDRMGDRSEVGQRCAPDALAGRIGGGQFGMRGLEIEQLAVKPVVLLVRNEWLRLLIIGPVELPDLLDQFPMFPGRLRHSPSNVATVFDARTSKFPSPHNDGR